MQEEVLPEADGAAAWSWFDKVDEVKEKAYSDKSSDQVSKGKTKSRKFFSALQRLSKEQPLVDQSASLAPVRNLLKNCTELKHSRFQNLQLVHQESCSNPLAFFVCEDGKQIGIPLSVIIISWPKLAAIIQEAFCCDIEATILVPGSSRTVQLVVELMISGQTSPLSSRDVDDVNQFLKTVGLNWNTESHCTREVMLNPEGNPDTVIVGECFDETEETFVYSEIEESVELNYAPASMSGKMLCSQACTNQCYKLSKMWSSETIQDVKEMFTADKIIATKSNLISHLGAQEKIGVTTDDYMVHRHVFCVKFLSFLTGISDYILKRVLEDYWQGVRLYEHGNSGVMKQQTPATTGFLCWFKDFASLNGQSAPDDQVLILAYWLNEKAIFQIYLDEVPKPHIGLSTFYQHMKTFFGPNRIDHRFPCVR
jgi:hypothetical protein